jgi:hypothetical protein
MKDIKTMDQLLVYIMDNLATDTFDAIDLFDDFLSKKTKALVIKEVLESLEEYMDSFPS